MPLKPRALRWPSAFVLWMAVPTVAFAFSSSDRFSVNASDGGGGGRYYTGSLADGYDCSVCHGRQREADWQLTGLPDRAYVPGQVYDIEITWPAPAPSSAVALEWVDTSGFGAGETALFANDMLESIDRCQGSGSSARVAARGYSEPNNRNVIGMDACGATRLRFRWTAPPAMTGPVWFHAVTVQGDSSGTPAGDAFGRRAEVIQASNPDVPVVTATGCSLGGPHGSRAQGFALAFLLSLFFAPRGRRRSA